MLRRNSTVFVVIVMLFASGLFPAQAKSQLPIHKFTASSRPGKAKAQIRAIVKTYPKTELEWKQLAVNLSSKHPAAGSYLVTFFDDESCLEGWDGTGLLRDSDWPHWLGRATVETNSKGNLYARFFQVAIDKKTGKPRKDVLK